jgi:hypothetical protein
MRHRRSSLLVAGLLWLILIGRSAPARSDDPVTSAVRFNREVVRIFQRKCLACHSPGGIAMSLATHRDARPWARAIREELVEQRMPPWSAARGSVRFQDDIGLTPRELTTILTWVDGGVPKGDDRDLPAASPDAAAGLAADHLVALPPHTVPGNSRDIVRRVTLDTGLTADRWVQRMQFRPGDRRLLRAAFVSIVPARLVAPRPADGGVPTPVWAASWTPWQPAIVPPSGGAFLLRAGSQLTVDLYYRGLDTPAVDRSVVEVVFAADTARREVTSLAIRASGRREATRRAGERRLAQPTTVWAVRPESLGEGQSLEVTARTPDGAVQILLWIPRYHAAWPAAFVLAQPIRLPSGTVVRLTAAGTRRPAVVQAILAVHP